MITYSRLGRNGLTGNQLFQYAMLLGVSEKHGYKIAIPPGTELEYFQTTAERLDMALKLLVFNYYAEESYTFDPKVWQQPDWTDYNAGYYQTEKYFAHAEERVRRELRFKPEFEDFANGYISWNGFTIAVHVRRSDALLRLDTFMVLTSEYYRRAMTHAWLPDVKKFLVFSDDIPWCKANLAGENISFVETPSHIYDLAIMAKCNAHIISASSFGWWGAWLAKSEVVIVPDPWFVPGGTGSYQTPDLIPERWHKLPVGDDYLKVAQ